MVWIRNTRAWSLLKGVVVILAFIGIAVIFNMQTILWIVKSVLSLGVVAIIVVLQPELRKALEDLGKKKIFFADIFRDNVEEGLFSDQTIKEIARAAVEMGKVRTGALIVVKQTDNLTEFEKTGIAVDAIVTSQLLINIFEHNTPLHDGAIIIKHNRIVAAACTLPLTRNKNFYSQIHTRHKAAIGLSERTDALVLVVSEETGIISVAINGTLNRHLNTESLFEVLDNELVTDEKIIENQKFSLKNFRFWQ